AKPPARYGAIGGRACGRLCSTELHHHWGHDLYPENRINRAPELVPGFPDRLLPNGPEAERELSARTLTGLYNDKPTWLVEAHRALDAAVAAAYVWPSDISDDEALERLFALNQERAGAVSAVVMQDEPVD
ncbi:type IIL restriction-modification enzyme MmeI, partial [Bradyrhizobium sp. NAS80.1]|uniref:type IIL restriction-modification enzyme MmeI n=1 Tax=Bradyrhizobium sp. NAS80.1 TaxID=1680159 RepID=UPI001AEFCC1A